MSKLKYLLFFLIIFLAPKTFAYDFNVTSKISSPVNYLECGDGSYAGTELNGATNCWKVNTRYNGLLQRIRFNLPVPTETGEECFVHNLNYTVTMNMATQDWRNRFGTVRVVPYSNYSGNYSSGKVTFISMKKISFTFKIPSSNTDCHQFVYVDLPSSGSSTPFTGDSNWNLSSVVLTDPSYTTGGGSSGGGSGGTTGPSNQDIINNNTQNSQNIMENDDNNTQDIIENNNNNTQTIIEGITENQTFNTIQELNAQRKSANSTCKNYYDFPIEFGKKSLDNSGQEVDVSINNYYTPQYINIDTILRTYGNVLRVINPSQSMSGYRIYFYDSSYNMLSYVNLSTRSITIPTNAQYFKFVSPVSNTYIYRGNSCISSSDEINNTINNSNVDSGTGTGFFDNFTSQDFGLSQIITIPLNTIQSLTSKTCVPLQVPIPFTNSNVSLPCMTEIYQSKLPTIYNLWKIVSFGIIAYLIAIDIFHIVKGFKDPDSDKIEVLDL